MDDGVCGVTSGESSGVSSSGVGTSPSMSGTAKASVSKDVVAVMG